MRNGMGLMNSMLQAFSASLISIPFGPLGWFTLKFYMEPFLRLRDIRVSVHEELYYTANIRNDECDASRRNEAVERFRRMASQLSSINVTIPGRLRQFLVKRGYDIPEAVIGLIGLSNTVASGDGSRAVFGSYVQRGLKLPREHTDEDLERIIAEKTRRLELALAEET